MVVRLFWRTVLFFALTAGYAAFAALAYMA
jgi:hypothetical protein